MSRKEHANSPDSSIPHSSLHHKTLYHTNLLIGGLTDPNDDVSTQFLKEADVHVIGRDTCRANYEGIGNVTDRMFCSGEAAGGTELVYLSY